MPPRLPRRFSLAELLTVLVLAAAGLAVRQAVFAPVLRRAEAAGRLTAGGMKVERHPPGPSWRDWLFAPEDLLEVTSVEGGLPPGAVADLARFPELTTVRLRGCDVSDADAANLARVGRLSVLDVANTRIGDAGIARLTGLPLTDLDVMGSRVTADGLESVAKIVTLRRLILPTRIEADRLAVLGSLTRLTVLSQPNRRHVWDDPDPSALPAELGRLPLVSIDASDTSRVFRSDPPQPWHRTDAPELPPELVDRWPDPPAEPWGYLPAVKLVGPTDAAWRALARHERLMGVELSGNLSAVDFVAPGGPRVPILTIAVEQLTSDVLTRLVALPVGDSLTINAREFAVEPPVFVAALTAARPRPSLTVHAPVDFALLPGVGQIAEKCPIPIVQLGTLDQLLGYPVRFKGMPRSPDPGSARQIEIREPTPAPPAWQTEAMLARGDTFTLDFRLTTFEPREIADWAAYFGHPATWSIGSDNSPAITPELLKAAVGNPSLETLIVRGGFIDDAWLARIVELPKLRYLFLAGGGLTDAAIGLVEAKPDLTAVLVSPRFSDEVLAKYGSSDAPLSISTGERVRVGLPFLVRPRPGVHGNRHDRDMLRWDQPDPGDPMMGRLLAARFPDMQVVSRTFRVDAPPWDELRAFPAVRHLELDERTGTVPIDGWAGDIPGLETLESLGVAQRPRAGRDRVPTDLTWLPAAKDLAFLAVDEVPVTPAGLVALRSLPNLVELRLDRVTGQGGGGPSDVRFLRNGRAWRALVAPDLRLTAEDLRLLADMGTVRLLAVDGVLLDGRAVPAIKALLDRGAHLALDRVDLDRATVARLAARAKRAGGSFEVGYPLEASGWWGVNWATYAGGRRVF